MPREVEIQIRRTHVPTRTDYLFGTVWHWSAMLPLGVHAASISAGYAYTEKGARRKAERTAARMLGTGVVEYKYNPAGLS